MSGNQRPNMLFRNLSSKVASIPMALTALVIFIGCSAWTVIYSFTGSRLLPKTRWVGFDQYDRLWDTTRWIVSIENLAIYGGCMLVLSLVLGFTMAALLDQRIRFENTFRTIFLYPYALSFVVTGLTWQWRLNPTVGLQQVVRDFGFVDLLCTAYRWQSGHLRSAACRSLARNRACHGDHACRSARHRRRHLESHAG